LGKRKLSRVFFLRPNPEYKELSGWRYIRSAGSELSGRYEFLKAMRDEALVITRDLNPLPAGIPMPMTQSLTAGFADAQLKLGWTLAVRKNLEQF
jgi:hypothetical protein